MKIGMKLMAAIIMVVIFGGIGMTMAMQVWSTESDKQPNRIAVGDAAGSYDPEDIRGSYTFADVSRLFEIEGAVLLEAFGFPAETPLEEIANKDLEGIYEALPYEIGNGSVKLFVALYKGLPIELGDDYLPERAVAILQESGAALSEEQLAYVTTHQVALPGNDGAIEGADETDARESAASSVKEDTSVAPAGQEEHDEEDEPLVKGPTTFQQLLDAGLTREQVEAVIHMPMPPTHVVVKDFCMDNGLSFGEVKEELESLR